jgi:hypothetical protein
MDNENEKTQSMEKSNLNDPFWTNDYKILFYKERIPDFFPLVQMTLIEKLNAIMRMGIILSLILYLVTGVYQYLYIMIIIGLITYYIYKTQKENMELYFNSIPNSNENIIQKSEINNNKRIIEPTVNNPFMNINLITDDKTKPMAEPSWNNDEVKKEIEDKFGYNLYRDVGDLYGKSNSQREFYTMPSTTIPNNQTSFAKWCYATGPTCKEKAIYCSPEMDAVPYIDNTNPLSLDNKKY